MIPRSHHMSTGCPKVDMEAIIVGSVVVIFSVLSIGGPSHTSSGWLSFGLCSVSTVRQFSASLMKARRTVAVSLLGYLACV